MAVDLTSLFAKDHAYSQGELASAAVFRGVKNKASFTIAKAIVGEIPVAENGRIDGLLDDLSAPMVVLVSECPYRPFIGQRVTVNGRTVSVKQVSDDPSGVTYPLQVGPETNA